MSDLTPAQELRAAASKIRDTAAKAMPGPWQPDGPYWHNDTYGKGIDTGMVSAGALRREVAVATPLRRETEQNMPHIALWHPGVVELVADWLDAVAVMWDGLMSDATHWAFLGEDGRKALRSGPWDAEHALKLARAINGGAR